jgi:hypothetical protein
VPYPTHWSAEDPTASHRLARLCKEVRKATRPSLTTPAGSSSRKPGRASNKALSAFLVSVSPALFRSLTCARAASNFGAVGGELLPLRPLTAFSTLEQVSRRVADRCVGNGAVGDAFGPLPSVIVTTLPPDATSPVILFALAVASSGCCTFGVTDGVTDVVVALLEDDPLAGVAPVTVGSPRTALPAPHPVRAKTVTATTAAPCRAFMMSPLVVIARNLDPFRSRRLGNAETLLRAGANRSGTLGRLESTLSRLFGDTQAAS